MGTWSLSSLLSICLAALALVFHFWIIAWRY
jgi:hypothetical protein